MTMEGPVSSLKPFANQVVHAKSSALIWRRGDLPLI